MDYIICISKDKSIWKNIFDDTLVFNNLTDEHALKILLMQKIKPIAFRKGIITIYLHDYSLEELGLHPKLYTIIKYSGDLYGIFTKEVDGPDSLTSEEIEHIKEVNSYIHKEYLDKRQNRT